MEKRRFVLLILILGTISALSPFSIDMYLPAFPAIAKGLHAPISQVQLSLTSFFLGISAGQLLYGPLLDRFGRKIPLCIGMLIYVLASGACSMAQSAHMLIIMRLVQALGSCAGMVASRALVRDLFPAEKIAEVFSLLMLVIAVSPMLAPTIGGYVSAAFGWHAVFLVLAVLGLLTLAACLFWLPEGRPPDVSHSLLPRPIIKGFYEVLKNPNFYPWALTGSLAGSAIYAYLSGSPEVFINIYRVSQKQYGWIFAFIAAGLIGSSQVNSLLLNRFKSHQIIRVALSVQSVLGLILVSLTALGQIGPYGMVSLIFLFLCCQGFTFPNASALSITPFPLQAGTASALMGTLQMGIGALASALVSQFGNGTALPMTLVMAACSIAALTVFMASTRRGPRPYLKTAEW